MSSFEKPILIFSEFCEHSQVFIEHLRKFPELFKTFVYLNIDPDINNNRPNIFYKIQNELKYHITEVPTIITINAKQVLSGIEVFKWLDFQTKIEKKEKVPLEFNPNEMGSISDMYSPIDGNIAAKQNYMHFNDPIDEIDTPPENDEYDQNGRTVDKEQELNKKMEQKLQERNLLQTMPKQVEESRIDWNSGKIM